MSSMSKEQFIQYHRNAIEQMHATMLRKNADYTGNSADPFANFTLVEASNICTTETGILVRMTDKMSRIASLISNGGQNQVKDESIVDTLLDLGNYAIILAARMQAKAVLTPELTEEEIQKRRAETQAAIKKIFDR